VKRHFHFLASNEKLHARDDLCAYRSVSIFGAGVTASLQSSSAALTTIFDDPFFMQGVMSGQGAIGFAVSITQFLAALNSEKQQTEQPIDAPPNESDKLISSTYNFFLVSLLFTAIAAVATYVLIKMSMYKDAMERHEKIEEAGLATVEYDTSVGFSKPAHQHQHHKGSIWDVNRKVQDLGCALAYIYVISIGLFPSITSAVQAVNKDRAFSSVSSPSLNWAHHSH
jgi:equilibrative nucleoside transporter 1/2/3